MTEQPDFEYAKITNENHNQKLNKARDDIFDCLAKSELNANEGTSLMLSICVDIACDCAQDPDKAILQLCEFMKFIYNLGKEND